MVKACLVIVFNHRYDKNIPVLEKMYSGRFSRILFLVPFYDGAKENVIPVYESSHYFQSYFAQGYHRFQHPEITHYFFIGDDCILHPSIDEHNFQERMGVPDNADFLPQLIEFHKLHGRPWWHAYKGIDFFGNRKGAEIASQLPAREEAVRRFAQHGLSDEPLTLDNIFGTEKPAGQSWWRYWLFRQYHYRYKWRKFQENGRIRLPYPVAGSYSDILLIHRNSIQAFCRYCGVMAAAGLFVEIAVPTALLLAAEKIVQEKDLKLQGEALWTPREISDVEEKYNRSLSNLLQNFPPGKLYYHPVKLSKWTNDL